MTLEIPGADIETAGNQFDVPILFMIFNRPETEQRVFEAIRQIRPKRLFIAGDGPRANRPGEAALCEKARAIVHEVDWPCDVKTFFRDTNDGHKFGPINNLNWFFDHVEEGIILEDDCLPHPTFFLFCQELLKKYRDDTRIMHIGGINAQMFNKKFVCNESYYFLSIPSLWGWATWRRAWQRYDAKLRAWPDIRDRKQLCNMIPGAAAYVFGKKFEGYWNGSIDSWDGQWLFVCLLNRSFSIYPSRNLISNIGFSPDASLTTVSDPLWDSLPTEGMPFPLIHPTALHIDRKAETYNFTASYGINRQMKDKIKWWFKSHLTGPYLFLKERWYRYFAPEKYHEFVRTDDRLFMC